MNEGKKPKTRDRVLAYVAEHPAATYREIVAALGLSSLSQVHKAISGRPRSVVVAESDTLRKALAQIDNLLTVRPGTNPAHIIAIAKAALAETDPLRFMKRERLKRAEHKEKQRTSDDLLDRKVPA